jgi:hypothetical protein
VAHSAGRLTNITAMATDTDLNTITLRTLKYLRHKSIGVLFSASPENPTTIANGGSVIFRQQRFTKWKEYKFNTRNDEGDLIDNKIILTFNFDKSKKSHYELETLDLPKLDLKTRGEYLSMIQEGIQLGLSAFLDATFLKTMVDDVKAEKDQAKSSHKQLEIADIDNLDTANKRRDAYRALTRKLISLTRRIDDTRIGEDPSKFACFLHNNAINDLLMEMPQGGDSSTAIGRNLATQTGSSMIAGILYKDHVYLGQDIPKDTSFDKETDFDFSNIYGAMVHTEAVFCAIQGLQTTATNAPYSGNQLYISKFSFAKGIVRPNLFALIVKNKIAVAAGKKK